MAESIVTIDGDLRFTKVTDLGPYGNNAYVIADLGARVAMVVDAPAGSEAVLPHLEGLDLKRIVITHRHPDHWAGIDALTGATGAPVFCHVADSEPYAQRLAGTVAGGDEIEVGGISVRVLHTPGHTPGSICLLVGGRLLSGDTLFPGGPGRTARPEDLRQEIESITRTLYVLADPIAVHPGHGGDTAIGLSKAEYAAFAARPHPEDLRGDVTWAAS